MLSDEKSGRRGRHPRESISERRATKAEIDDPNVVLDAALRFIEVRQRSVAEVRRRLTHAGYRDALVAGAIERLGNLGILDDEAFARAWVESRDRAHPRGEHALMLELRQKGIDAPIVAAVLRERREAATRWDGGDEPALDEPATTPDETAARKLLARHARALARVSDPRQRRQRAYGLLVRNGFSSEVASEAARESVLDPEPVADDGPSSEASSRLRPPPD